MAIGATRKEKRTYRVDGQDCILPSDAARAVGRFAENGPIGYKATNMTEAPLRATRAEAEQDYIAAATRQV